MDYRCKAIVGNFSTSLQLKRVRRSCWYFLYLYKLEYLRKLKKYDGRKAWTVTLLYAFIHVTCFSFDSRSLHGLKIVKFFFFELALSQSQRLRTDLKHNIAQVCIELRHFSSDERITMYSAWFIFLSFLRPVASLLLLKVSWLSVRAMIILISVK